MKKQLIIAIVSLALLITPSAVSAQFMMGGGGNPMMGYGGWGGFGFGWIFLKNAMLREKLIKRNLKQ